MILAAGLGSRMRPLTDHTPKPLIEVGGKPLIVWHIERLSALGFVDIVINVAYLGHQIIDYLGDGSEYGVSIQYSNEEEEGALETAGAIVKALPLLSETFLVVNGDVWTDYPFDREFVLTDNNLGHLILIENPPHNQEGDFSLNGEDRKYTFSGVGYYSKRMFENLPYGKRGLAPLLFDSLKMGKLSRELYVGRWYDIGTVERLESLNKILKSDN